MNIKPAMALAIGLAAMTIPQNGIGCGPDEDPHDYFTSFFSRSAGSEKVDKPFYYTSLLRYYDDWDEDEKSGRDDMLEEWKQYAGAGSTTAASDVVYKSSEQDLAKLASGTVPTSYTRNEFAQALAKPKLKPAANYLLQAKRWGAVSVRADAWEAPKRDSLLLNKYIVQANEGFVSAPDAFLKSRYAYQRCKLAFYNNRKRDCISWYDAYFPGHANTASAVPALSYKAGSLSALGRDKEAAYLFSKVFTGSERNRKAIFESFRWATNQFDPKLESQYTAAAATNKEKAAIIGMFALWGMEYRLSSIEKVYELDPTSALLPLLVNREVNKLEEQYFTPLLATEKGGQPFYYHFDEENRPDLSKGKQQLARAMTFLQKLVADKTLAPRGFYAVSAAYLAFMKKDMDNASSFLTLAREAKPEGRTADQLQMTDLLVRFGQVNTLDAASAATLLPSLDWLETKARKDQEYANFMTNFFSELVAQRYTQQDDPAYAALAYGVADRAIYQASEDYGTLTGTSLDHIRTEMNSAGLMTLYNIENNPHPTTWDRYLLSHSRFHKDDVVDVIGTAFLREGNYPEAITWLKKAGNPSVLRDAIWDYKTDKEDSVNVDPFYDYINDWQRYTKKATKPFSKLSLAQRLQEISNQVDTARSATAKSKLYYTWASGLYNISYYGNAWQAVTWDRSGVDWNSGKYDQAWKKEYYGVYQARNLYQKAYDAATDREFKAACLFMVLKCAQRQIPRPEYEYSDEGYKAWQKADSVFQYKFRHNELFPRFIKEFGNTRFYSYVYNRCSYLRDFTNNR